MSDDVKKQLNRREFFSFVTVGWVAFTSAIAGFLTLAFRYSYPNVNFEPEMDFVAGRPNDYEEGVDERWKNGYGVWIVKMEGRLFALSNICTHLGCVPNWLPAELKFKCPCHGSGYYQNGINFEGPAPRPLERYKISLNAEGKIIVDKTKIYRYEKGQWDNPQSYLKV
ncbi:ubiquinol-cytochrome c reductase iron-sulfur subunit [Halobacteriovorax sp. HFRX-2_2]|uniref:QcrA and Rieske domain-containing protein n=1 Tax=unclassified Halobacteriovorax TaxID=2639665 RepID=UPI0037180426